MGEDRRAGRREAEAVDEARVVEEIAEDLVLGLEEGGEDADVELEAAREEHGVGGAGELGEAELDLAVDRVVAADQAGGGGAGVREREGSERRVVGQTEVVVAAKADDRSAVDSVMDTLAVVDARRRSSEAGLAEGVELDL